MAAIAAGIVSGCNKLGLGRDGNPVAPTDPPAAGSTIVYSALGASDANGVGSSMPCVPFDQHCNGMGYVYVTARRLESRGFTVTLNNLGIASAVIGRDFQALGLQYNRPIVANFIDQETPFVLANTTLVTIFAGVNEINAVTAALGGGAGGSDPDGYVDSQVRAFGADYSQLVSSIRGKAAATRIIALNVPNVVGLPYLAAASASQRQAAQRAAVGMTRTVVNALASQNILVVDLMCDSRTYLASNYSSDGMHPNDSGYAFIADEIERAATTAGYPPPQANCPSMTLVP